MLSSTRRWKDLKKSTLGKKYPLTISLRGNNGIPSQVELPSPLTLIFGLNGAGKSRLLSELSEAYDDCAVVSLSELINYLLHDFGKRDDIADLVEENSPLLPAKVPSSAVSDLVRRDYQEINWYAIPIMDSPFSGIVGEDVVPVFTARHAGHEYDFRSMGMGELSAHLLMWILAYSKEVSSPLLLDEPEAFMPSPSRAVVLSHLVEETIRRAQPMVIASHSLELIQPALDSGSAIYLSESGNTVSAISASEDLAERVAGIFGRSVPAEWLILCEDESAFILGSEFLRMVAPRLWQESRFLWCKGYGDLEKIWSHLPRPSRMPEGVLQFAFLADGDQKDQVTRTFEKQQLAGKSKDQLWPFFCLPDDPDVLMKAAAMSHLEQIAGDVSITEPKLRGLLDRLRGREAHNWIEDFLSEITIERQVGLRALAASALDSASKDGTLQEFKVILTDHGLLSDD